MIVCLCKVASDSDIREAIDDGARTVDAVGRRCGAGTGCGSCRRVIHRLLEKSGQRCAGGCPDCPRARTATAA